MGRYDYIPLGSSPAGEGCAQLGEEDFRRLSQRECQEFLRMMEELWPPIPGTEYRVIEFGHEFGTYHEVCAVFDPEDAAGLEWARDAENLIPEFWDDVALTNLGRAR